MNINIAGLTGSEAKIILVLQQGPRRTLAALAQEAGLTRNTTRRAVRNLLLKRLVVYCEETGFSLRRLDGDAKPDPPKSLPPPETSSTPNDDEGLIIVPIPMIPIVHRPATTRTTAMTGHAAPLIITISIGQNLTAIATGQISTARRIRQTASGKPLINADKTSTCKNRAYDGDQNLIGSKKMNRAPLSNYLSNKENLLEERREEKKEERREEKKADGDAHFLTCMRLFREGFERLYQFPYLPTERDREAFEKLCKSVPAERLLTEFPQALSNYLASPTRWFPHALFDLLQRFALFRRSPLNPYGLEIKDDTGNTGSNRIKAAARTATDDPLVSTVNDRGEIVEIPYSQWKACVDQELAKQKQKGGNGHDEKNAQHFALG